MHVQTLKKNIFYVNKTTNKGHNNMEFFGNHNVIKSLNQNGKQFVFHCQQKGNWYPLGVGVASSSNKSNVTSNFSTITKAPTLQSILWHHELGHLHLNAIKHIQNYQMVMGIRGVLTSLPICEGCILEKHQVSNFPSKSNSWSKKVLELVHINLCGPM